MRNFSITLCTVSQKLRKLPSFPVPGVQHPSSKFYIYDVELDKVFDYEFNPDYYATWHTWDREEEKLIVVEWKKKESTGGREAGDKGTWFRMKI